MAGTTVVWHCCAASVPGTTTVVHAGQMRSCYTVDQCHTMLSCSIAPMLQFMLDHCCSVLFGGFAPGC